MEKFRFKFNSDIDEDLNKIKSLKVNILNKNDVIKRYNLFKLKKNKEIDTEIHSILNYNINKKQKIESISFKPRSISDSDEEIYIKTNNLKNKLKKYKPTFRFIKSKRINPYECKSRSSSKDEINIGNTIETLNSIYEICQKVSENIN